MKRGTMLLHWSAGAGSLILTLSLLFAGGCSSSRDGGGDDAANAVGRYGLKRSELIAIKKANRNPKDFKKALLKQKMEKLQEEDVVVETTISEKTAKKPR
jgi:hypothetical protein